MVTVIYCTRESNPAHKEHLIKSSGLHKHLEVIEIINNGESLTKAYNRGLKQATNNIVVFCHDDLEIETKQWGNKLLKQFEKHSDYGIIGVAGTKFMSTSGQWWENRKKMYGRVSHTHEGKTWLSSYSPDLGQEIEEVVTVDGVFFAIDKTKINVEFNETVEGFHFYDVTFCFENYLKGVKIGVITSIRINHKSIGMTNEQWDANRVKFSETFKDNLPVSIKKVLRKGQKLKVLIGTLILKTETPQEEYIINLIKELKKQNCDISIATNLDKKYASILKQLDVKIYLLQEPPGFKLGDGKWSLKTTEGDVVSQLNTLYKLGDGDFDVIHINQKPVADHLLRLYPDSDFISTIHTTDRTLEEPVITPSIKKYLAIDKDIQDVLVEGYDINPSMVELADSSKIMEQYTTILS